VARIYDPRRAVIYQRLGIPTVATVTWTTDHVRRRLFPDSTATEWTDPTGAVNLVERGLPDNWAGRSLAPLVNADGARLAVITRAGRARVADPNLVGQEGDVLLFAIPSDGLDQLERVLAGAATGGGH